MGPMNTHSKKVPIFIYVSCQLFAHNFANICFTAVKLKFLESLSKMALDEYDFVKFVKKMFGTFLHKCGISQKVLKIVTWFYDMLCRTLFAVTYVGTDKIALNGPKQHAFKKGTFSRFIALQFPVGWPHIQACNSQTIQVTKM